MSDFFRYPQTPHLAWLGSGAPRDDKVLSKGETTLLLENEVIVEEKLDGANVGISLAPSGKLRFQNRGQFLEAPFKGQFARLHGWSTQYSQALSTMLLPGLILFGEWLTTRHSVKYNKLPGWFVAFDVYDSDDDAFWSTTRRDDLVRKIGLPVAPLLIRGRTSLLDLKHLALESRSKFGDTALEGLVVRHDNHRLNLVRAKLVRPDFVQSMGEHWRRRPMDWNRIETT